MPKTITKKKKEKVVFVCHSAADHEVIQMFKDGFFGKKQLNVKKGWRVRFTSDREDYNARLRAGDIAWNELTDDLAATEIFIACISDRFFKSSYCQNELGYYTGWKSQSGKKSPRVIPLIVGSWDKNNTGSHPIINTTIIHKDVANKHDLNELATEIAACLKSIRVAQRAVTKLIKVTSDKSSRIDKEASRDCVDLALQHFRCKPPLDGPLTFFVPRIVYQHVAVQVSEEAKSKLLWTLYKSPLLVGDAYSNDFLMPYDIDFSKIKTQQKIRLVIFEDHEMADAYAKCDLHFHNDRFKQLKKGKGQKPITITKHQLETRKDAFQQTARKNNGLLLFTTVERLNEQLCGRKMQKLNKNSCLEFGWTQFEEGHTHNLLFASGHNSEFAGTYKLGNKKQSTETVRHLTFFKPPLSARYSEITNAVPYGGILKWVTWHEAIAKAAFSRTENDCTIFVKAKQIKKL